MKMIHVCSPEEAIEAQTLVRVSMIDHLSLVYTGQLSYVLCEFEFLTCFIRFMAPFYLTCRNCELLCILGLFDCGLMIHVAPPDFLSILPVCL